MSSEDEERTPLLLEGQNNPRCRKNKKKRGGEPAATEEDKPQHPEAAFNLDRVSYFAIFQFASLLDKVCFAIGILCAVGLGTLMPLSSILFGDVIGQFTLNTTASNASAADIIMDEFEDQMVTICYRMCYLASAALVLGYFQVAMVTMAGQSVVHNMRKKCFKAIVRQNIAWYDQQQSGQLQNRLVEDLEKVRLGVSDKIAGSIQRFATFIAGLTIGMIYSWQLGLVICSLLPLMAVAGAATSFFIGGMQSKEQTHYAEASGIAEESISAMRTVAAFCKEQYHLDLYKEKLKYTKFIGIRKSAFFGFSLGSLFFILFFGYALAFWYGPKLIAEGKLNSQDMMTAFFSVMMGAMSIGQALPGLNDVAMCKGAASFLIAVMDREPPIDSSSEEGQKPNYFKGKIQFKAVDFRYPTRPEVQVLNKVSLTVNQGETVALVGHSGCGKSTIISLIQRFYNAAEGTILLDDVELKDLNLKWLRQQIGVVSQEPILFGYTIAENISFGKEGATREEVIEAAKKANANDFIIGFEKDYDTLVGEKGAQLSGGQKQRIAIARALIRDPSVLLLDEATSALDTESERVVQDALDKASKGRTTVVVAHRLSTIKHATKIIAFDKGEIVQQGTHDELMDLGGVYAELVKKQNLKELEEEEEDELFSDEILPGNKPRVHRTSRSDSKNSKSGETRAKKISRQISSRLSSTGEAGAAVPVVDIEQQIEAKEELPSFGNLLKLNSPEWFYILLGTIAATLIAGSFPIFAIFFGEMIDVLSEPTDEMQKDKWFWCYMFLLLGTVTGLGFAFEMIFLSISGERMTERIRTQTFGSLLSQDISYFDHPDNATGALTARLANDAALIQGATGVRFKTVFEALAGLVVGLFIAFYFSWQLALLMLAAFPFLVVSGAIHARMSKGYQVADSSNTEKGGKIIMETLTNIRTVHSFGLQDRFVCDYYAIVDPLHKTNMKTSSVYGLSNSFGASLPFFLYAAGFRLSTYLIIEGKMAAPDTFKVMMALMFASSGVGSSSAWLPDFGKAQVAAGHILKQLGLVPEINTDPDSINDAGEIKGEIIFEDIKFSYPTRRKQAILRGLTMSVSPGQKVALVGQSGCGKSTLMQLLLRFYDPAAGRVLLDGEDIRTYNLESIRGQMAIVSQEPTLFKGSIYDNIVYGVPNVEGKVSLNKVQEAAEKANIAKFIDELPDKYDTQVGERGVQLSGGQKQRIAIARALIRHPKILLLDEATSALDSESEKVVQEALDRAQEGRTCLVIAHRLSTIQDADKIVVVDRGQVGEMGTHNELLGKGGIYAKLCQQQSLQKNEDS